MGGPPPNSAKERSAKKRPKNANVSLVDPVFKDNFWLFSVKGGGGGVPPFPLRVFSKMMTLSLPNGLWELYAVTCGWDGWM